MFYLLAALFSYALCAQPTYTMQDLKILSEQGEFEEYLNHAKDILPSKRTQAWSQMTLDMGMKLINSINNQNGLKSIKQTQTLNRISTWPIFRKEELFRSSLRPIRLKELSTCLKSEENCLSVAKKNVKFDKDPEYLYQTIKILLKDSTYKELPVKMLSFLEPILNNQLCNFYINKKEVQLMLNAQVAIDSNYLQRSDIDDDCKKELSKGLLKTLYTTTSIDKRVRAKDVLLKWGQLHSYDIYYFNITQFLADYKFDKKELFIKWKTFRALAKNEAVRKIILEKLFKKKLLEGKILKNKSKSAKTITSAIARYIPEYFNQFANRCLEYFKGLKEAPSLYCHDLFARSKNLELFSNQKTQQYDKILQKMK